MAQTHISIRNARSHNLRGVSCEIPLNSLTVITGVSGSGKSTLAFDTLYAEGQRRYVTSLSTYARQFLERLPRPDVDSISHLPPAIAIDLNSVPYALRQEHEHRSKNMYLLRAVKDIAGKRLTEQLDKLAVFERQLELGKATAGGPRFPFLRSVRRGPIVGPNKPQRSLKRFASGPLGNA